LKNSIPFTDEAPAATARTIARAPGLRDRRRHMPMRLGGLAVCALALLAGDGAVANHLKGRHSTVGAGPVYNKPVYNPETKSYFELYTPELETVLNHKNIYGISWRVAAKIATLRKYKGVAGRLAVVKTKSLSDFLRRTFAPDQPVWIGLRYYCQYHIFQWVTGEFMEPNKDYNIWGSVWNQSAISRYQRGNENARPNCGSFRSFHWGVHYWPVQEGFVWNANGYDKFWNFMFIEYLTGKP